MYGVTVHCTWGAGALCSTLMASATACVAAGWERLGRRPSNCGSLSTSLNRLSVSRCSSSREYCRKKGTLSSTGEWCHQIGDTHRGNVEASTVAEVLQQLFHEQHLQVKATIHHIWWFFQHTRLLKVFNAAVHQSGLLEGLIAVCQ